MPTAKAYAVKSPSDKLAPFSFDRREPGPGRQEDLWQPSTGQSLPVAGRPGQLPEPASQGRCRCILCGALQDFLPIVISAAERSRFVGA